MVEFLVIGHICHDWSTAGNVLGGTAAYASLMATKWGLSTGILTSFGEDFEFQNLFQNMDMEVVPSSATTFFKNEYIQSTRQQYLLKKANNIFTGNFPARFQDAKMVLLGPIANEIDCGILDILGNGMLAICPQGWMRRWKEDGKVFHEMLSDWKIFERAEIVILSEEDLNFDFTIISELASLFKILVVTKSEKGADIYFNNNKHTFPAFSTKMIDPTGAGDIFATAFLIKYFETKDFSIAANFANAAASCSIEQKGIEGIPSKSQINSRINGNNF